MFFLNIKYVLKLTKSKLASHNVVLHEKSYPSTSPEVESIESRGCG